MLEFPQVIHRIEASRAAMNFSPTESYCSQWTQEASHYTVCKNFANLSCQQNGSITAACGRMMAKVGGSQGTPPSLSGQRSFKHMAHYTMNQVPLRFVNASEEPV